jgi:hypothetical protein
LEVFCKLFKFVFSPFFEWERGTPRTHGQCNSNTSLMDSSQVSNKSRCSTWEIMFGITVESKWKLPSLNLTATISIIFTWLEPFMRMIKLDISKERNLIDWSFRQTFNSDLFIWTIYLKSKCLSNISSICPHKLFLSISKVGNSSMSWWQYTWSIWVQWVVEIGPLPCFNILAAIISTRWMACTIFMYTSWSVLGNVQFFTIFIGDIIVNLCILQRWNWR